jgi:hypothetical protein
MKYWKNEYETELLENLRCPECNVIVGNSVGFFEDEVGRKYLNRRCRECDTCRTCHARPRYQSSRFCNKCNKPSKEKPHSQIRETRGPQPNKEEISHFNGVQEEEDLALRAVDQEAAPLTSTTLQQFIQQQKMFMERMELMQIARMADKGFGLPEQTVLALPDMPGAPKKAEKEKEKSTDNVGTNRGDEAQDEGSEDAERPQKKQKKNK